MNVLSIVAHTKVTGDDMQRALAAVNALPLDEQLNSMSKFLCMAKALSDRSSPGEIGSFVTAVDFRFAALTEIINQPEFSAWQTPENSKGARKLSLILYEAAAKEPLILTGERPKFDAQSFLKHLLLLTKEDGAS